MTTEVDRNNAAALLATQAGWMYLKEQRVFHVTRTIGPPVLPMPAPNDPLSDHLSFIGLLCRYGGTRLDRVERGMDRGSVVWTVTIFGVRGCAGDPSHAAVIAAHNLLSGRVSASPEQKQLEPLRYLVAWSAVDDRTEEEKELVRRMLDREGVTLPSIIAEARYLIEVADILEADRKANGVGRGEA